MTTLPNDDGLDYRSCATHNLHPFYQYLPPPYADVAPEHTKAFAELTLRELWDALESIKLEDVLRLGNSALDKDDDDDDDDLDSKDEPWFTLVSCLYTVRT